MFHVEHLLLPLPFYLLCFTWNIPLSSLDFCSTWNIFVRKIYAVRFRSLRAERRGAESAGKMKMYLRMRWVLLL